jgi:hypothetical protein
MHGIYGFDDADETLTFMPTAVRRALDVAGRKLSLEQWRKMSLDRKRRLVLLGAADTVDVHEVQAMLPGAAEAPVTSDPVELPREIELDPDVWARLSPLDRYALVKFAGKPDKRARVMAEIVGNAKRTS